MAGSAQRLVIIGANHRSASLTLRDGLFVDDEAAPAVLAALKTAGLAEAMMLSTCDRVEVWTCANGPEQAAVKVAQVLAARAGLEAAALVSHLYTLCGADAVEHGFAVTASLDSLVIGEPHVTGQVKAAHRLARDAGMMGGGLDHFVQAAFAAAKRVRSETAIGEGPVSIAAAAVQVARDLHGELGGLRALLVGAGEMGELVAESLQGAGLRDISVAVPRLARAEAVAKALDAHVLPFEEMREALAGFDVVLTCVGARTQSLSAEMVSGALRKRRRRPMFLVDAGIPGDVEPAVNRVDGAFLYDLADLEKVALEGRAGREAASQAARAILAQEVETFLRGRAERAAVPAIVSLRSHFEEARAQALAEAGSDAAEATRLLVNRLLHVPSEVLKGAASGGAEWQSMDKTLRILFRLEE